MEGGDLPAVVAIGGGTGMPVLLAGLKEYTDDITAIVSVADDGGSSGRLRDELGIVPPGDIRNCLAALAEGGDELMKVFQYRFSAGSLTGHSMGNIMLAAAALASEGICDAIELVSRLLEIRGRVLPSSLNSLVLRASKEDGTEISGQTAIMNSPGSCRSVWIDPPDAPAPRAAVEAVGAADLVVLGPGSLFTSVIPNLLIPNIRDALAAATCPRVFVCNLISQPGETDGFTASDHLRAVQAHGAGDIDAIIVQDSALEGATPGPSSSAAGQPVACDADGLRGVVTVRADVARDDDSTLHDSRKLAAAIMSLLEPRDNCPSQLP